jgi:hypothetical protein
MVITGSEVSIEAAAAEHKNSDLPIRRRDWQTTRYQSSLRGYSQVFPLVRIGE